MPQSQEYSMHPIAHIRSDFAEKFGVPRQSGLVEELEADIVFEPAYRNPDTLRGLEDFSHIWLIWVFDRAIRDTWSPTVRPPRLGGNTRMGVFATRSPFRPNPIALSCVKLAGIRQTSEGAVLRVKGADPFWTLSPIFLMPTATRRLWAALPPSPPGRPWRSPSLRRCWSGSRRTIGKPFGAYWPKTPGPITRRTPTGSTGFPLPAWRSAFLWMETASLSGTSSQSLKFTFSGPTAKSWPGFAYFS